MSDRKERFFMNNKTKNQTDARRITRKRDERINQGICRDCGRQRDREGVLCTHCRDTRADYSRRRKAIRADNKICMACGSPLGEGANKKHCQSCIDKTVQASRLRRQRNKIEIINYLGGCCIVCGEDDIRVLTVDHTNGDGAEHRRSLLSRRKGSVQTYAAVSKLIREKKPIGWELQILCFNCHAKKDLSPWWLQ